MKDVAGLALLIAAWTFALACGPKELPPEPPFVVVPPLDDGGQPLCRLACENLAKMGCPEATPDCRRACEVAESANNSIDPICVANASTPDQVRGCGTVYCIGR